jgi:hypothetical protein
MFRAKKVHLAVVAVGRFQASGLLNFTSYPREQKLCPALKTGHYCEIEVHEGFSGSYRLPSRTFLYFSTPFPDLDRGQFLQLVIELDHPKSSCLHLELSGNQFAKFGGTLLRWESPQKVKLSFKIYADTFIDSIERLYFSIVETTQKERQFKLRSSIQVNQTITDFVFPATQPEMTPRRTIPGQRPRPTPTRTQSFSGKGRQIVGIIAGLTVLALYCLWSRGLFGNQVGELSLANDDNLVTVPMLNRLEAKKELLKVQEGILALTE